MFRKPEPPRHINPRYRAYGRARLDVAQRARSRQDWDMLWKPPQNPFPFDWGEHWKQCIEYRVDDFAAEIGFLIDVLGLPVNAFNSDLAMFTSPDHEFYFAVAPTPPGMTSTPPGAFRIQFMVADIFATTEELKRRGVAFEHEPEAVSPGSESWVSSFKSPHGIIFELWGLVEMVLELPDEPEYDAARAAQQAYAMESEPEQETAYPETTEAGAGAGADLGADDPDYLPGPYEDESAEEEAHLPGYAQAEDERPHLQPYTPVYPSAPPPLHEPEPVQDAPAAAKAQPAAAALHLNRQAAPQPERQAGPTYHNFKSGDEMLRHLQEKRAQAMEKQQAATKPAAQKPAAQKAPAKAQPVSRPLQGVAPRPAPKPRPTQPDMVDDEIPPEDDFSPLDETTEEGYHYRPIRLDGSVDEP